jgi:hypothetical protein
MKRATQERFSHGAVWYDTGGPGVVYHLDRYKGSMIRRTVSFLGLVGVALLVACSSPTMPPNPDPDGENPRRPPPASEAFHEQTPAPALFA